MCRGDCEPMSTYTRMNGITFPVESADGGRQSTCPPQQQASGPDHWWKDLSSEECAITGFPLSMLPYPPFHFRMDPNDPESCKAVDAKFLVLQVMATGEFKACGRNLVDSDVAALDQHVRRCNLGRFRLGNFLRLQNNVTEACSAEERALALSALRSEQEDARKQFRKLQHIQSHRLKDLNHGKKAAKKKAASTKQKASAKRVVVPQTAPSTSQQLVLMRPSVPAMQSVPRVIRWADASDEMVEMASRLLGPNISMSFLDNLQHWRTSTESAKSGKGNDIMSRRLENVSWRLWASGADPALCAPDFLSELDKRNNVPQLNVKPLSVGLAHDRGRENNCAVKIEEIFAGKPSEVLQNWRVSTKEPKIEIIDGQARSRRENQLWRLMALSQKADPKSQAIVRNACTSNPTLGSQIGAQSPVALGMNFSHSRIPSDVARTPSPGSFAYQSMSAPSPSNASIKSERSWLRTPSPECRPWMATSRPLPVLEPRTAANSGFYQGMPTQSTATFASHGYYMQPMPLPMPQVVSVMPAVPVIPQAMPSAMPKSSLPDDYVCVAVPKHMVQQIQEELSQKTR
eukprot:gnl/MRDRNA2_/MRDRNA2_75758_c0_seq1.p1 gnl/MRDRNA2_/MRDRNA2_75758_c0~~gnl/MRDRNA2_/MRDRNA2_75758_c0_seq1.p1  ORF type:complete len:573 (+),score=93.28 gnl/MRDRNA2_/MRDRNA2_75758_c0_seq1:55-1773(+)